MSKKGFCLVGQSGGPTAVINASLQGVIESIKKSTHFLGVLGTKNGIEGILNENFVNFDNYTEEEICLLRHTPSTALGSVRYKMPNDLNDPLYNKIKEIFLKYNITAFLYIGGNDSMDTAFKISEYFSLIKSDVKVIGIPKTIDNDMCIIDHTPGFASASKFIATTISEIYLDTNCYTTGRVTFVEIMGRDSGWLTCAAKIPSVNGLGPDLIYVPEVPFDLNQFLEDVSKIYKKKKKVLVAVSEGIKDENGNYFLQKRLYNRNDDFGHLQLGGVGMVLAEIVSKELNLPVRSVELNILQRSSSLLLSKTDVSEAYKLGSEAVNLLEKGFTGKMICLKREENGPYKVHYYPVALNEVANFIKSVPLEFINERHNNINDNYLDYILPLIEGEVEVPIIHGIPKYFKLKD